jgi:extracellular elastinolytic metalloproteinase
VFVVLFVVNIDAQPAGATIDFAPDTHERILRPAISVAFLDRRRPIATRTDLAIATAHARAALDHALGRPVLLQLDPRTRTPRFVGRLNGYLTAASASPARSVAMGFVRAHLGAFGLTAADLHTFVFRNDYVDVDGIHHLSWIQVARGVPAFDNGLEAAVTRAGRLVNLTGSPR